jgi:hypothetical protein
MPGAAELDVFVLGFYSSLLFLSLLSSTLSMLSSKFTVNLLLEELTPARERTGISKNVLRQEGSLALVGLGRAIGLTEAISRSLCVRR